MMFKAGVYKQQYQCKSFLPTLLEKPFQWQSDTVLELLSEASRYIGVIEGNSSVTDPLLQHY